jgi:hypothetical protein
MNLMDASCSVIQNLLVCFTFYFRYQEAGDKLAVENFKLTDELAKQKVTLQDINEFLTNELKARSVTTTQV